MPFRPGKMRLAQGPYLHARAEPLVAAAAQRRRRARGVGEPFFSGAEHQRFDELAEDHRIVDAAPVTAQRMVVEVRRQQGEEIRTQRLKDAGWDGRHEASTTHEASAPSRAWSSCLRRHTPALCLNCASWPTPLARLSTLAAWVARVCLWWAGPGALDLDLCWRLHPPLRPRAHLPLLQAGAGLDHTPDPHPRAGRPLDLAHPRRLHP